MSKVVQFPKGMHAALGPSTPEERHAAVQTLCDLVSGYEDADWISVDAGTLGALVEHIEDLERRLGMNCGDHSPEAA